MRRIFFALVLVAVALPASGVIGAADAQDTGNGTATNATTTEVGDQVTIQIDEATKITEWRYQDGRFQITIKAAIARRVTVTDVAAMMESWSESEGATSTEVPSRTLTIDRGTTTISFNGQSFDEQAAVTVATGGGIVMLSTGGIQAGGKRDVPMRTLQIAVLGTFLATGYGSYRITKEKMDDTDAMEAERII